MRNSWSLEDGRGDGKVGKRKEERKKSVCNRIKSVVIQLIVTRGEHFRFGSVFIKKSNQTDFFFFSKIQTETEPKFLKTDHIRFDSVRFF